MMDIIELLKTLRESKNSEQAGLKLGINRNTITNALKSKLSMTTVQIRIMSDDEFDELIETVISEQEWIKVSLKEILTSNLIGKANRTMIKKVINSIG